MGFYHYLLVEHSNGGKEDIGGYSKGGSQNHWFFAFSPTEYFNNAEEVVTLKSWDVRVKHGYKTTVEKAQKRLQMYLIRLKQLQNKPLLFVQQNTLQRLTKGITSLVDILNKFDKTDNLLLDQSDGTGYSYKLDEEQRIIGLQSWWYQNYAADNEKIIQELEQATVTLEEMIEDVSNHLQSEEINDFFNEVISFVAHEERSYGPNPASEIFDHTLLTEMNNPSLLYKQAMYLLLTKMVEENVNEYDRLLSENDIVSCSDIIVYFFEEFMEFNKKYT